jgi:hypothetical protein
MTAKKKVEAKAPASSGNSDITRGSEQYDYIDTSVEPGDGKVVRQVTEATSAELNPAYYGSPAPTEAEKREDPK